MQENFTFFTTHFFLSFISAAILEQSLLSNGIYLLELKDNQGPKTTLKLIKS
ncbi:hypothetical protein [Gelidibacter pelagius]|uniref:T9SS type A sorting domain-containing protein n=1 Tax=Gelidibacter pelagius TaxID=2819985 RepID=A0ABS3STB4_9FLAO|nr:hypothetical protein [Gelidibacter pelagius]MBO3098949.1 hypothetical protein [Gelidibacter pelagius]